MRAPTPLQNRYLAVARVFHFAYLEHFVLWMTGRAGRHSRSERALPALVKKGYVKSLRHGKRNLYATPERLRLSVLGNELAINPYHGLACTDILVRLMLKKPQGEAHSENACRMNNWGVVPEWMIRYEDATAVVLEFCTSDNVEHHAEVTKKLHRYQVSLPVIEDSLQAKVTALFVLDVPSETVQRFKDRLKPDERFTLVDYLSFRLAYPL